MRRVINLLLTLSTTGLLVLSLLVPSVMVAQDQDVVASEPEIVYVNEPIKPAVVEQADDEQHDVMVKEEDSATDEVVAQESGEEPEIVGEPDDDLNSEKSDEVVYEEYT